MSPPSAVCPQLVLRRWAVALHAVPAAGRALQVVNPWSLAGFLLERQRMVFLS